MPRVPSWRVFMGRSGVEVGRARTEVVRGAERRRRWPDVLDEAGLCGSHSVTVVGQLEEVGAGSQGVGRRSLRVLRDCTCAERNDGAAELDAGVSQCNGRALKLAASWQK